jgi:hypothetical protein
VAKEETPSFTPWDESSITHSTDQPPENSPQDVNIVDQLAILGHGLWSGKKTPTEVSEIKTIDDLRLYNKKKKNNMERKAKEEEGKRKQDREAAVKEAATKEDEEEIIF